MKILDIKLGTFQRIAAIGLTLGVAIFYSAAGLMAADRPVVTSPRATSGDAAFEPAWEQRISVTVGPTDNTGADLVGKTDKVLQAAVDYIARLGGGTVTVLPGTYRLRNGIILQSNVRIIGSGSGCILFKEPSVTTKLATDTDGWELEITLVDTAGFELGDAVCLHEPAFDDVTEATVIRTLVARNGNRFKLDRQPRMPRNNYWTFGNATASTACSLISGNEVSGVVIENLTLDGNRGNNANIDGNWAGGIYLHDCSRITIRQVTERNFNGDGMSWQTSHDVVVENCVSENNAGLGLHAGGGSQRPVVRNNRVSSNDIGMYFCYDVRYGLVEKNELAGNRVGISIGHRDTDNLIVQNSILNSKETGIEFRAESDKAWSGNRNRIEKNRIVDSGGVKGVAIDVQGGTQLIGINDNEILETRAPEQRIAINLGAETHDIAVTDNSIKGFSKDVNQRTDSKN